MAEEKQQEEKKGPSAEELLQSLQRTQADFQNFRARMERERAQWREETLASAVAPLLTAFDGLERALASAKSGGTLEGLLQGVTQVDAQIAKALTSLGISRVPAEGKPFDPKLHEILAQVPAPAGTPAGQVVNVVEQGYTTAGGRLIRPARVTVAAAEAEKTGA